MWHLSSNKNKLQPLKNKGRRSCFQILLVNQIACSTLRK
uniref:Uncharacterized protein n=1 Tax=Rhizophora mucronata TaxID=61149 RepID=A0A2P2NPQ2_RHIMU